ncbi:hypothetical protein B0H63DRAFT_63899 [Podospora didyma]|uniref:MACPF domain-containing protein n=1 Tax=Podospora didyma TaxID=330526 RepID=A0AAE0P815_9PEZI|nr:hypothetical protein B0H63DRAFT_63899 [Podospora didyma]
MGLVEDFPQDPFFPSLRYAATCQAPVRLPWAKESIMLGTSLSVSRQDAVKSSFLDKSLSALSKESLEQSQLVYSCVSRGSVVTAETKTEASSHEHSDYSISASIGGSFLGASGRVRYERAAASDENRIRGSFRTRYENGMVSFQDEPRLSPAAVALLRGKDGQAAQQAFRDKYGEYYVAGYILGGANATMVGVSTLESAESKDMKATITIKVLFIKKSIHIEKSDSATRALGAASLAAYDTLAGIELTVAASAQEETNKREVDPNALASIAGLIDTALDNQDRGWNLVERVEAKTGQMGLDTSGVVAAAGRLPISREQCDQLCREGLVVELLLLPYAGLRHYVQTYYSVTSSS